MKTNPIFFKNLHLRVSAGLILLIALTYGFSPQNIVPGWAEFKAGRVDLPSIFKALMGMYLSMALVWVISTLRPQFWYGATLLNIFFTLGLAVGRLVSLALDGLPSAPMLVGFGVEGLGFLQPEKVRRAELYGASYPLSGMHWRVGPLTPPWLLACRAELSLEEANVRPGPVIFPSNGVLVGGVVQFSFELPQGCHVRGRKLR